MDFDPLPQQRLAIEAPLGPVLVIAGPGAGKTFCLIRRIHHLVSVLGIPPARICAVTFTNKAAEEIATRLERALGADAGAVTRGTLHALCLAILREHARAAGLREGFGIADEAYQRIVLTRLRVHPKRLQDTLTRFGRRRLENYELAKSEERIFQQYTEHLAQRNMLDFDDLIRKTRELLTRVLTPFPPLRDAERGHDSRHIAGKWDYLLVDEFQDLNRAQYEILKSLAAPHNNFFAVGDDEQSVFSWTGADPRVLVRFRDDYAITDPIVLDRNCRCSRQIFETARRVLAKNPQLFDKELTAERHSEHEVLAYAFPDEEGESSWVIEDLQRDRADVTPNERSWGDYALLYRKHRVGEYLESRLVRAGIPCRLARGRSIAEDEVVGHVIAALRVIQHPGDPVAIEALAQLVFSEHLMQDVRSAVTDSVERTPSPEGRGGQGVRTHVLDTIRHLAQSRPRDDPDTKKLWRFVYQVENLAALARSHRSLPALIDDLLSQRIGPYRNVLEERHEELSDPASLPEAVRLAARLAEAIAAERPIVTEPRRGLEIALRGMLGAAGIRRVPSASAARQPDPRDLVLTAADGGEVGLAVTLFKAIQILHSRPHPLSPSPQHGEGEHMGDIEGMLKSYVAFDLEATDNDPSSCDIIEIGAARVRNGEIVARFHSLVRPTRPISHGAQKVHGYSDADVAAAPLFESVWPELLAFVGEDVLVAHGGQHFDVPVLQRHAAATGDAFELVFYDTLPLARSFGRGARLTDLAARFGIDPGRAHHALDDACTLASVFRELERARIVRARKAMLVNLLDYLGLALALELPFLAPLAPLRAAERADHGDHAPNPLQERSLLFDIARYYALGRYSECLEFYATEESAAGDDVPSVEEVIGRLGGRALMTRLRAEPDPERRYPAAVARLRALIAGDDTANLEEGIALLLERVALSKSEGVVADPDRVNLLTLHSTKGLEFSRVYVVGVEDFQLPGYRAMLDGVESELQEARRLLYVGMTRACDRLVLTRAEQRFGMETGGSTLIDEIGLNGKREGGSEKREDVPTVPSQSPCSAAS